MHTCIVITSEFPLIGLYQEIQNQINRNPCSVKCLSFVHIPGNFKKVSSGGGQALSPHGEEASKDLMYLNDAYKRAIIDSH